MNIEHISVSRSKSYKQCPYYYKLKYHDKIPNPGEEQFYFVYGKIVHKIAETHVQEKGKRPLKEIANDVLKGKIEIENGKQAPSLPLEYKKRISFHLKAIEKLNNTIGCDGITEHNFKYDLDPPNKKLVTGFIDRLIVKENKAWIIDYKTTKKGPFRENKKTIKYDPQLRLYCRVVQKEFNLEAKNIKAALFYLEDEELLSSCYDENSLCSIEKELLDIYNKIHSHEPQNAIGQTGNHCQRCEYKNMCPFFRNVQKKIIWDGDLSKF